MFKRVVSILICLLALSPVYAGTYYVSSTLGSNDNDGLTEQTPRKDFFGIPKKDVTIRLKCGDVFWGGLSGYTDCRICSYGRGARPVLCGFKVLANPAAWQEAGDGLWQLDLSNNSDFEGNTGTDGPTVNNIGFIYDASADRLYGRNVVYADSLCREMDFCTSSHFSAKEVEAHPFRTVTVKRAGNPSELGPLCFPVYGSGMEKMVRCEIEGIAVVGFSLMGMHQLYDCTVTDCQIDLIGGGIQIGYGSLARLGNGVELWDGCCGNTITRCLISRTYDCATTIQANGAVKSDPYNNIFVNNRIYRCRQAFEHFINPADGSARMYFNCSFSGNVCYEMGENEFNCPEARDCNILSYENDAKSISIKDNVFFGANHLDGTGIAEGMSGNTIYVYRDQYLYTRHWHRDKKTIISGDSDSVRNYRDLSFDNSRIVVLRRGSLRARMAGNRIRRQVGWSPVDLHLERLSINANEQ